jgi:hypothetical protein
MRPRTLLRSLISFRMNMRKTEMVITFHQEGIGKHIQQHGRLDPIIDQLPGGNATFRRVFLFRFALARLMAAQWSGWICRL